MSIDTRAAVRRTLALALWLAACSDGDGSTGEATATSGATSEATTAGESEGSTTDASTPAAQLCEHFFFACGCMSTSHPSFESCLQSLATSAQILQALAADNGLTHDPSCFADYAAEVIAAGCATPDELSDAPDEGCSFCAPIHGEVPAGQPCVKITDEGSDCAQGLRCADICFDPCAILGEGEICGSDEHDYAPCGPGLFCAFASKRCEALPGPGEACNGGDGCVDGFFCDEVSEPMSPSCAPRRELGEPCIHTDDCVVGLRCDALDLLCVAPPGAGELCDFGECAEDLWCDLDDTICKARLPAGAACADDLACVNNTACSQAGACEPQAPWFCEQP